MADAPASLSAYSTPLGPADAEHPQGTLSDDQKAEADLVFAQLEKEADYEGWKYMSSRVPAAFQEYFLASHPNPMTPPVEGAPTPPPA